MKRWIDEGRGLGERSEYRPWIMVNDFSSRGTVCRELGIKTKRMHHFYLIWNTIIFIIRFLKSST